MVYIVTVSLPLVVNGNTIALCGMAPIRDSAASTHSLHDLHLYKLVVSLEELRTFSSLSLLPSASLGALSYQVSLFLLSITPAITNYFAFLSTQPFDSSTPFVTASLDVFNATPDAQRPNS